MCGRPLFRGIHSFPATCRLLAQRSQLHANSPVPESDGVQCRAEPSRSHGRQCIAASAVGLPDDEASVLPVRMVQQSHNHSCAQCPRRLQCAEPPTATTGARRTFGSCLQSCTLPCISLRFGILPATAVPRWVHGQSVCCLCPGLLHRFGECLPIECNLPATFVIGKVGK